MIDNNRDGDGLEPQDDDGQLTGVILENAPDIARDDLDEYLQSHPEAKEVAVILFSTYAKKETAVFKYSEETRAAIVAIEAILTAHHILDVNWRYEEDITSDRSRLVKVIEHGDGTKSIEEFPSRSTDTSDSIGAQTNEQN